MPTPYDDPNALVRLPPQNPTNALLQDPAKLGPGPETSLEQALKAGLFDLAPGQQVLDAAKLYQALQAGDNKGAAGLVAQLGLAAVPMVMGMKAPMGKAIKAYHGSVESKIDKFLPNTHFGTAEAANERLEGLLQYGLDDAESLAAKPTVHEVKIYPKKTLTVPDLWSYPDGTETGLIEHLQKKGLVDETISNSSKFDPYQHLRDLGYDSLKYKNAFEDAGSHSYVVLNPDIVEAVGSKKYVHRFP